MKKIAKMKNPITPEGYEKLCEELDSLLRKERPEVVKTVAWAASNGDRSENADYHYGKKKLREIDKRIQFLNKRIDSSQVIDPKKNNSDIIDFGATVSILTEDDIKKKYSIVGIDEVDISKEKISWQSPLGAALLNKKVGDWVSYKTPKGEMEVEIIGFVYDRIKD